ncbi:MAG: hypothetical protein RLZZ516_1229, partial [Cyanobacteriota bacterium]
LSRSAALRQVLDAVIHREALVPAPDRGSTGNQAPAGQGW